MTGRTSVNAVGCRPCRWTQKRGEVKGQEEDVRNPIFYAAFRRAARIAKHERFRPAQATTGPVFAIGEDYGGIGLEGVQPVPAIRVGDVAVAQLTWHIKDDPEPTGAFVHLIDVAGMRIAHQDVPAGGTCDTPLLLWAAGLAMRSIQKFSIP